MLIEGIAERVRWWHPRGAQVLARVDQDRPDRLVANVGRAAPVVHARVHIDERRQWKDGTVLPREAPLPEIGANEVRKEPHHSRWAQAVHLRRGRQPALTVREADDPEEIAVDAGVCPLAPADLITKVEDRPSNFRKCAAGAK